MRPLIALTASLADHKKKSSGLPEQSFDFLKHEYSDIVHANGGTPLILPNIDTNAKLDVSLPFLQGIIFSGGGDYDPSLYGQQNTHSTSLSPRRDKFEFLLLKHFEDIPILGICRGFQLLNIYFGGTLHQDFTLRKEKCLLHRGSDPVVTTHKIKITRDSLLWNILKEKEITVDSSHHQILDSIPERVKPVAWSEDGVVEAIEIPEKGFCLGVQWHPERINDQNSQTIFRAFIKACQEYKPSIPQ
ncbi:gamma-glutamyl-gamma-aminobutyrate hydrolase family protein [bacterium]|nr:gamma-glutamyl-gamma-aminobutyrate hydrolase family protein [bacterium]